MSDYSKTTNFSAKDALATGNSAKVVKGSEIDTEFNDIATAIATKVDEVTISSARLLKASGTGGIADSGILVSDVSDLIATGGSITGEIRAWTTASAPTGWLICDGAAVSRTTYSTLFALIGTTYGVGDGSTTFNVPDGVGRTMIGAGTGTASDATAHSLGDESGAETHTLTISQMPAHLHDTNLIIGVGGSGTLASESQGNGGTGDGQNTDSTGGGGSHNNMQPYFVGNWIIKT